MRSNKSKTETDEGFYFVYEGGPLQKKERISKQLFQLLFLLHLFKSLLVSQLPYIGAITSICSWVCLSTYPFYVVSIRLVITLSAIADLFVVTWSIAVATSDEQMSSRLSCHSLNSTVGSPLVDEERETRRGKEGPRNNDTMRRH